MGPGPKPQWSPQRSGPLCRIDRHRWQSLFFERLLDFGTLALSQLPSQQTSPMEDDAGIIFAPNVTVPLEPCTGATAVAKSSNISANRAATMSPTNRADRAKASIIFDGPTAETCRRWAHNSCSIWGDSDRRLSPWCKRDRNPRERQPSLLRSFGWQAISCEGCPLKLERRRAGATPPSSIGRTLRFGRGNRSSNP